MGQTHFFSMRKQIGLSPLGPQYLRVQTPRTSDGTNLVYDKNRQPIYDESESPLSARKHLDRINKKLPEPLKMLITEVDETKDPDFAKIVKGVGKTIAISKAARKLELEKELAELSEGDEDGPVSQTAKAPAKAAPAPAKLKPGQHKPKAPVKEAQEELV